MATIANYADQVLQSYTPRYIRPAKTFYTASSTAPWLNSVPNSLPLYEVAISTPGSILDPLGTQATLYSASVVDGEHYIGKVNKLVPKAITVGQSTIYIKSDGTNYRLRSYIRIVDAFSVVKATMYITVLPLNGQIVDTVIPPEFTNVSYGVTNVGNGWYKVTIKFTSDLVTLNSVNIQGTWNLLNSSSQLSYIGDGSSGFYGYAPALYGRIQPDEVLNDLWTDTSTGITSIWNGYKWVAYGGGGASGAQVGVNLKDSSGTLITGEIKNSAIGVTTGGIITGTGAGTVTLSLPAITGVLAYSQMGSIIDATKFATGVEPVTIVSAIPATKQTNAIFNTANNKLYRWDSTTSTYTAGLPGADITGTISTSAIADGSLAGTKFASGIEPIGIVSSLPVAKSTSMVFLTTDSKLYKWDGTAYVKSVDGADIIANSIAAGSIVTGSITTTQLQAGGINADRLVAGSITTDRMSANSIHADRLVASSITTGQIAAGAIKAAQIDVGAITTNKMFIKSSGSALNPDPNTEDITAWSVDGTNTIAIADEPTSPVGSSKVLRCTRVVNDSSGIIRTANVIPISSTKNYQVRTWIRQVSGSSRVYLTVVFFNAIGQIMTSGSTGWPAVATFNYYGDYNQVPSATWKEHVINFGPNSPASIPTNAVGCYIGLLPNYGTAGVQDVTGIKICERVSGDLVVEGSITSTQMDTKGLIIRDTAGTPILGVGNVLADGYAPYTTPVIDRDRTINRPPSWYPTGTTREFKQSSSVGLDSGPGYYCTLETIKQYQVGQGGYPGYQYAYQGELTWRRRSVDDAGSAWTTPWVQDLDRNAYTGDLNATKDLDLVASGTGVSVKGSTITATGTGTWGSMQVYSRNSYLNGAIIECMPDGLGACMIGLDNSPTDSATYTAIDYAIYFEGTSFYVWESNQNAYGPIAYSANSDLFSIIYDGITVKYLRNGSIFKTTTAGPNRRFYLDSAFANTSKLDKVRFASYAGVGQTRNLQDVSWWSPAWGLNSNGWGPKARGNHTFVTTQGPSGNQDVLLRIIADSTSNNTTESGGWEYSNSMEIDVTKTYRFIVPIYREPGATGTMFWGIRQYEVCHLNTTSTHGNPYFAVGSLEAGKWYLFVGYVFPAGSTGSSHTGSGIYDMSTGALYGNGENYTWPATLRYTTTRMYQHYSNAGSQSWAGKPQVELVDGSETPLASILATGAVSARNPITSTNSNLLVFNGAIKANHITVSTLSAIKADLGYITAGHIHGGAFSTGSYSDAWAWPGAGGSGVHLSSSGLLMGDYVGGKFFQITAGGNLYAPQFSIENGNASFSGTLNVGAGGGGQPRTSITNSGLRVYNGAGTEVITLGIF